MYIIINYLHIKFRINIAINFKYVFSSSSAFATSALTPGNHVEWFVVDRVKVERIYLII